MRAGQCLPRHVYYHYRHLSGVEVDAHRVGGGRVDAERSSRLATSRGYGPALLHDAALYQPADYDRYSLGGEPRALCDLDTACPFRHLDGAEHDVGVVGADPREFGTAEHWPAPLPSRSFDSSLHRTGLVELAGRRAQRGLSANNRSRVHGRLVDLQKQPQPQRCDGKEMLFRDRSSSRGPIVDSLVRLPCRLGHRSRSGRSWSNCCHNRKPNNQQR